MSPRNSADPSFTFAPTMAVSLTTVRFALSSPHMAFSFSSHAPTHHNKMAVRNALSTPSPTACARFSFTLMRHLSSGPTRYPPPPTFSIAVPAIPVADKHPSNSSSVHLLHTITLECLDASVIPISPPPQPINLPHVLLPVYSSATHLTIWDTSAMTPPVAASSSPIMWFSTSKYFLLRRSTDPRRRRQF